MAEGTGSQDNAEATQAVLAAASKSLLRRGYLTTEWWTTVIGGALSAVLAVVHVSGTTATHVVAVAVPALLAALYAITRTMHKSAVATALEDVFPQAAAGASAAAGRQQVQQAIVEGGTPTPVAETVAQTAVAQTDPDFAFLGIPPIEDVDG